MDHNISNELYSEALKLSNERSNPYSEAYHNHSSLHDKESLQDEDNGSFWDDSEEHNIQSDLDREWQKRHDRFRTIGYRDGLTAGKEASAQEGFNIGFKESVIPGYRWGLVRGVTSALAFLPEGLREKLVKSKEDREKYQYLYKSVLAISTKNALKTFGDSLVAKRPVECSERAEASADVADPEVKSSSILENYDKELKTLSAKTPDIEVKFMVDLKS